MTVKNNKLSGIDPLAYLGVQVQPGFGNPPTVIVNTIPPTPANWQNFNIGDLWVVALNDNQQIWLLVSKDNNQATWVQLFPSGVSGATTFPTDAGTAVEVGGVLNMFGDGTVTTSGAGNTVTVHLNGAVASLFVEDVGTATPSAGILNIVGGTNINTAGAGNTVTINMDDDITVHNITVNNDITAPAIGTGVVQVHSNGILFADNGTNGQILIGGDTYPAWANITSTGGTILITNGPNTINLETSGGGGSSGGVKFQAWKTNTQNQTFVTGNSTTPSVPQVQATYPTLVFDSTGGYNTGTSTFTAPLTGKWLFNVSMFYTAINGDGGLAGRGNTNLEMILYLVASGANYNLLDVGTNNIVNLPPTTSGGNYLMAGTMLVAMAMGDTAQVWATVTQIAGGTGNNNVALTGEGSSTGFPPLHNTVSCFFSGVYMGA